MQRHALTRWTRRLISAALLLASLAVLVIWFRSYTVGDRYRWARLHEGDGAAELHVTEIEIGDGGAALNIETRRADTGEAAERVRMVFERRYQPPAAYTRVPQPSYPYGDTSAESSVQILGVGYSGRVRIVNSVLRESITWTVPLWMILLVTSIYPLSRYFRRLVRHEREDRALLGLCPRCAVDVRHDPAQCPGCGMRYPLQSSEAAIQSVAWQRV